MSDSQSDSFRLYQGTAREKDDAPSPLPLFEPNPRLTEAGLYLAAPGLRDAVNVALALGQPLIVTGEPGTGKTRLAHSIAAHFGLGEPLAFYTKTTSTADDLFYRYDALRHFHDIERVKQGDRTVDPSDVKKYLGFRALGLAILMAGDSEKSAPFLPPDRLLAEPTRSVVLIDEVDKAPRDFPNDILNETENLRFTVTEIQETFQAKPEYRPFVLLTSNSERDLPDAFLRRCVFYYIPPPTKEELIRIVETRLKPSSAFTPRMLENAVDHFEAYPQTGAEEETCHRGTAGVGPTTG
jgi:MoxR-like ATPase